MKIRLLRANSLGFTGTLRNAQHHAQKILPYIYKLAADVQGWGYLEWLQAHNTHVFVTKDGRKVILRPIHQNKSYVGVSLELSNNIRCASGKGMHVANIISDVDSPEYFSQLMKSLAASPIESVPKNEPLADDDNGEILEGVGE